MVAAAHTRGAAVATAAAAEGASKKLKRRLEEASVQERRKAERSWFFLDSIQLHFIAILGIRKRRRRRRLYYYYYYSKSVCKSVAPNSQSVPRLVPFASR